MKQVFILRNEAIRRRAMESVWNSPDNYKLVISEEVRSLEQNSRLWPSLTEISNQVMWHGRKLSPDDWKMVFTASLKKMDVVPNLENTGFVALGLSTSKMSKRELSDLLELVYAFGAEHGVVFKDLEAA
jgi:hypothetical protein